MTPAIQTLITACEWSASQFLIISDNVFAPLIYYSHLGSVIPSVILALFIFFKGPKKLANRLLLLLTLAFTIWVFCDLVTWATEFPSYTMFSWSLLILFEPLVYFFAFYFFYVLIFEKDFSTIQKILFSFPLLITFLLTPTRLGLLGYDVSNCDRAAVEGIVATYGYAIEILYVFLILGFLIYFLTKNKDITEKRKAVLITTGIVAFLLSFSLGNITEVFTQNWYIGQYGLFGAPVFVGFLAYVMVKYKTFNTKIFGAQALVVAVGVMVVSMLFVRYIENVRYVIIGTLILFIPLGYQLIRSVKREIESREKIEKLAEELKTANQGQSSLIHFMNHQIKGRFGNIKNIFAELLTDDYGTMPPATEPLLHKGADEANVGINYVTGILKGASAENGTLQYEMKSMDLKTLVEDVAKKQKEYAEKKGLEFSLDIDSGDYSMSADVGQLGEAVKNLIDNAINYTITGSVSVKLSQTDKNILFKVTDTGVGITQEDKERLFKAGGRGVNSLKVNINATGYGLVFVKNVALAHKGRVWVESDGHEKGSTFYLELPKS